MIRSALRSMLDAVLLLDRDPFADAVTAAVDRFASEVESITPAHLVALVLSAPDRESALYRLAACRECLDTAAAMIDPDDLESLYRLPAYGEEGWGTTDD